MQISSDAQVAIEPVPVTGPTNYLVKCKLKVSPKCQLWHFHDKPCCSACQGYKEPEKTNPFKSLSPRQSEVLRLYCEGKSIKEIGPILGISNKTVEYHYARIKLILNLFNPILLVHYALHNGLVKNHFTA